MHPWKQFRVRPGARVRLDRINTSERCEGAATDRAGKRSLAALLPQLERLQALLYAEHRHRVLVVLQGMDSSGKDATIRRVFEGVNPQGVRVARFGPPTPEEAAHDFLWRVHAQVPRSGEIAIFNRSHYEDVLWPSAHRTLGSAALEARMEAIVAFERLLVEEGTAVLKFFLHIDRAEQRRRFEARLRVPEKQWKFSVHDLEERPLWPRYQHAYEALLSRTSTKRAPWFVIPSDPTISRDLAVGAILVRALEKLDMHYPPLDPAVERLLRRSGEGMAG